MEHTLDISSSRRLSCALVLPDDKKKKQVVNNGSQTHLEHEQKEKEIYFSSTEGVTIHLTDPTFAVNITGKVGGPVSSILANIFSLGKPKRGQDAKIIDVHSEKTANFVTELRMISVQSDKHVIAANQVAVLIGDNKRKREGVRESQTQMVGKGEEER